MCARITFTIRIHSKDQSVCVAEYLRLCLPMHDWLFAYLIAPDHRVVVVYVCMYTRRRAWCLDIETFIVKLSELPERVEMDISLCDSQRSTCHTSP